AFETVVYDVDKEHGGRAGSSQFTADQAIGWLKKQPPEKPFCIYLGPPVPHDPRVAPPEFVKLYDPAKLKLSPNFLPQHPFDNGELRVRDELLAPHPRTPETMRQHLADYYACISCFDHHLGRIVAELQARGQLDNTLIIYTSDHGLAVGGRHGLLGKQHLYEHNKPPLILAGPGVPAGKQSAALVYLFDLLPTVCEAAKLAVPRTCDGLSLMPVVRGDKAKTRDWLLGAYRDCQRMVRDERWKLIAYNAGGVKNVQLFDLAADPDELKNLAGEPRHADQRARLEKLLTEARKQFGDPSDFDGTGAKQP
ncbi:MAG: sulfatase-like hydrolase/transferase, partial [Planctomycetia bacterium]|nr:sulfatase-like hydrolase/transferase [Planctomycetia bacterium]